MTPPNWPAAILPGPSASPPPDGVGAVARAETAQRASQVRKMREHDRQQTRLLAGRALGSGAGCPPPRPAQPGVRRGQQRVELGGLWPLLVPVACCGGPLVIAGLAAAGALAWGGLGLVLATLLVGVLTVIRLHRRARTGRGADSSPVKPSWPFRRSRRDDHTAMHCSRAAACPARFGLPGGRADPVGRAVSAAAAGVASCPHSILNRQEVSGGPVRCDRHRHGNRR